MLACLHGQLEAARYLVEECDADVDAEKSDGATAFYEDGKIMRLAHRAGLTTFYENRKLARKEYRDVEDTMAYRQTQARIETDRRCRFLADNNL